MIKRREFITLLGGAAALPLAARAQQGDRMRRIGVLAAGLADDSVYQASSLREAPRPWGRYWSRHGQKKRTLAILAAPDGMAGTAPGAAAGPFYRAVRAPVHGPIRRRGRYPRLPGGGGIPHECG